MPGESCVTKEPKGLGWFERYLTVWVLLCIGIGILLGNYAPETARYLDSLAIYSGEAPIISTPHRHRPLLHGCFYIMVKIDFAEVLKAGKNIKPVALTLFVNWAIKPFTMYAHRPLLPRLCLHQVHRAGGS